MSRENATCGAPRILSELLPLGHAVAKSTVAKCMARGPKPPSRTWRTFLENHAGQIAGVDFFTVATVTFRVLYVFLVLRHDRRYVVHFHVTTNPTAQWTAQQIVEAFPYDQAPRFLFRDRDGIYGQNFRDRVEHMGIEEVLIAFRSPWQSPYVERLIGSIRRECLDHVIVLDEEHLGRILSDYPAHYHEARLHLSLGRNSPIPRPVCPPAQGKVVSEAFLGGLHHCYTRAAQRPCINPVPPALWKNRAPCPGLGRRQATLLSSTTLAMGRSWPPPDDRAGYASTSWADKVFDSDKCVSFPDRFPEDRAVLVLDERILQLAVPPPPSRKSAC